MPTRSRLARLRTPLAGLAAASLLFAACGDDDADDEAATVEPVDESDALLTPQLGGLEVTVTGNVTEVLDDDGFQIDKDGLGTTADTAPSDDPGAELEYGYFLHDYDVYDYYEEGYDYYDYDYYTAFDEEYDDFDETAVLVVTPGGAQVDPGQAVQVNGTLRYFDEESLEAIYDLDFDDDLYGTYEEMYVIVADAVQSMPADRDSAMAEGSTTTTVADGSAEGTDDTTTTTAAEEDAEAPEDGSTTTTAAEGADDTTTTTAAEEDPG